MARGHCNGGIPIIAIGIICLQEHETPYKMRRASWVSPIHPAGSQAAIVSHNWCIFLIHANDTNRLSSQ